MTPASQSTFNILRHAARVISGGGIVVRMDRRDDCVCFGSRKPEQIVLALDSERSWAGAMEACNAASSARSTE
jgi:hypothetical protein